MKTTHIDKTKKIVLFSLLALGLLLHFLKVFIPPYSVNEKVKLIDDYHLECNNQVYEFDYLLIENQSFIIEENLPFVKDGKVIITNWVGQTSIEHIYIGNFDKAIDDLLDC